MTQKGPSFLPFFARTLLVSSGKGGGKCKGSRGNIGWMNQLIQVPLWLLAAHLGGDDLGGGLPADGIASGGGPPADGGASGVAPADGGASTSGGQQVPGWLAEAMADARFMDLALALWIQYGRKKKRQRPDVHTGWVLQGFHKDKDEDNKDKDKDKDNKGGDVQTVLYEGCVPVGG